MDSTSENGRVVDAGRGSAWWAGGWRLFAACAVTWIGIIVIYFVISAVLNLIPFVGALAQALLTPVFAGGIMLGCRAIERTGTLRVAHLFEGFQGNHFVPLMLIGAVNIGIFVAIALVGSLGVFGSMSLASLMRPGLDPMDAFGAIVGSMPGTALLIVLLMFVLSAVFMMLNWFAPALVALGGANAWSAMKRSLAACLRNWLPFLIYGLIGLAIMVAAMVVLGIVAFTMLASAFTGVSNSGFGSFMVGIVVFGLLCAACGLVLGPIVFGTTYAGYVDIFEG